LNFGHTFGHAIEAAQGYGEWPHGEAVAAGMVCAARLPERVCGFDAAETQRLVKLIAAAGLSTVSPPIDAERWLELMHRDKKVEAGAMRFVVLRHLGEASIQTIDERDAADVIADDAKTIATMSFRSRS